MVLSNDPGQPVLALRDILRHEFVGPCVIYGMPLTISDVPVCAQLPFNSPE